MYARTVETRARTSASMKGLVRSPETRARIAASATVKKSENPEEWLRVFNRKLQQLTDPPLDLETGDGLDS